MSLPPLVFGPPLSGFQNRFFFFSVSNAKAKSYKDPLHGKQTVKGKMLWLEAVVGETMEHSSSSNARLSLGLFGLHSGLQFKKHTHIHNLS